MRNCVKEGCNEPDHPGHVAQLVEGVAMIYTHAAAALLAAAIAATGAWQVRLDRTHGVYFPFRS
jgi:hypothetical protein